VMIRADDFLYGETGPRGGSSNGMSSGFGNGQERDTALTFDAVGPPVSRIRARDFGFERKMLLARLRYNLLRVCEHLALDSEHTCTSLNRSSFAGDVMVYVGRAFPRSNIVPWNLSDAVVIAVIEKVVREFLEDAPCHAQTKNS
jgi:hypothetical protein